MLEFDIPRKHALRSCSLVFVKTGEFLEGLVASSRVGPTQSELIAAALQGLHEGYNGILDLIEAGRSVGNQTRRAASAALQCGELQQHQRRLLPPS